MDVRRLGLRLCTVMKIGTYRSPYTLCRFLLGLPVGVFPLTRPASSNCFSARLKASASMASDPSLVRPRFPVPFDTTRFPLVTCGGVVETSGGETRVGTPVWSIAWRQLRRTFDQRVLQIRLICCTIPLLASGFYLSTFSDQFAKMFLFGSQSGSNDLFATMKTEDQGVWSRALEAKDGTIAGRYRSDCNGEAILMDAGVENRLLNGTWEMFLCG